jgi:hypothetical protein
MATTIPTSWTVTWPWPQIYVGNYYSLVFRVDGTDLKLYEVYCDSSSIWKYTEICVLGTAANISYIGVLDFGQYYVLSIIDSTGDSNIVRLPGITSGATCVDSLPYDKAPNFRAGCAYDAQAIIGGITSTAMDWTELGKCAVAWSAIGRFDFRPEVHRTAGYTLMHWADWNEGTIHRIMRSGDFVMVYGNGGIEALKPITTEIVSGYTQKPIHGFGINDPNHVGGDETTHCLINTNNDLCLVVDGKLSIIGYREYMEELLDYTHESNDTRVRISYSKSKNFFYISNGNKCFVLTPDGLYECHQMVTSVGDYRGHPVSFFSDNADYQMRWTSDVLDWRVRALKTLETLEFGLNYYKLDGESAPYDTYASVMYKYGYKTQSFTQGTWVTLNNEGNVFIHVTANEFKLRFKAPDYRDSDFSMDYVNCRLKLVDKRTIRGPHNAR